MTRQRVPTGVLLLVVPVIAVGAVLATFLFGSDASDGSAARRADEVIIKDFAYLPDPLQAQAGMTLTVKNLDDAAHTLTADDDVFDTGNMNGGVTKTIELDEPGRYAYHCAIHDYMTGVIRVGG